MDPADELPMNLRSFAIGASAAACVIIGLLVVRSVADDPDQQAGLALVIAGAIATAMMLIRRG